MFHDTISGKVKDPDILNNKKIHLAVRREEDTTYRWS